MPTKCHMISGQDSRIGKGRACKGLYKHTQYGVQFQKQCLGLGHRTLSKMNLIRGAGREGNVSACLELHVCSFQNQAFTS